MARCQLNTPDTVLTDRKPVLFSAEEIPYIYIADNRNNKAPT